MRFGAILAIVAALWGASLPAAAQAPTPLPADVLFGPADVSEVSISPDGTTVAYLAAQDGRANIWLRRIDGGAPRALIAEPGRGVFSYAWSKTGERIVYLSGPRTELDTRNVAGPDYVLYSAAVAGGPSTALSQRLDARVLYQLGARRVGEVFLSPSPRGPRPRVAQRFDLSTGAQTGTADNSGLAPVYADEALEPRLATRSAERGGLELLSRANGAWRSILQLSFAERILYRFYGFSSDSGTAYLVHTRDADMGALVALDLDTGAQRAIARNPRAMIANVLLAGSGNAPFAYKTEHLRTAWTVLDPAFREDFAVLSRFDRGDLDVVSMSADASVWVVSYQSDIAPKRYFLYRRGGGAPAPLFAESEARMALAYASTRPVSTRSGDGLEITGYLTLPRGADRNGDGRPEHALPTIVYLHGGPWGRTSWEFDAWAQYWASRGYAALNVNFRGSTGFGKRFVEAHYGEWGGAMERDTVALVRWAIAQRIADPERIAVTGLSHGGYATLSLLSNEPSLARCGVTMSALSDLNLFFETLNSVRPTLTDAEDIAEFEYRAARERMQFGADERTPEGRAFLASRSPITKTDHIRAPLLMSVGMRDAGVVPAHSERLAQALAARGAPVTLLAFAEEGHVITGRQSWRAFLASADAFLGRCMGVRDAPVTVAAVSGARLSAPVGAERVPGLAAALSSTGGAE